MLCYVLLAQMLNLLDGNGADTAWRDALSRTLPHMATSILRLHTLTLPNMATSILCRLHPFRIWQARHAQLEEARFIRFHFIHSI